MRTLISILLFVTVFVSQAFGQVPGFNPHNMMTANGSEFFVGRITGKPLITVYLLSGVHNPGVYHIPVQTDLGELIAYAGGVSESAAVDDISIRSRGETSANMKHFDLEKIVSKSEPLPSLQENDTIHIGTRSDTMLRTLLYVSILSAIASIALTTHTLTSGH